MIELILFFVCAFCLFAVYVGSVIAFTMYQLTLKWHDRALWAEWYSNGIKFRKKLI